MIDFTGPWAVFQDVDIPGLQDAPFRLYTVAEKTSPITASGGMRIIPDYDFNNAPRPKVIVIPAQSKPTNALLEWIQKSSRTADLTMSVCTGAFVLAKTGLLSGKAATTHHTAFRSFAIRFPDIQLKRGARFVEEGNLATAGGLSSGIDLALRVVERYFGRQVAEKTAYHMEYQGQGWTNADSNRVYAKGWLSPDEHPPCAVCQMEVDPTSLLALTMRARPITSAPIRTRHCSTRESRLRIKRDANRRARRARIERKALDQRKDFRLRRRRAVENPSDSRVTAG